MQDKRIWDTVPLSKSLPTNHPIRKIMSKSASKWKWATERVMFFKEGKVFIQSVTAYGTGMFLLQCDAKMGESVSNVQVVQNFDWKHKVSVMSPCLPKPELRIDLLQAGPCKAPHILSFGPTRITKGYTKTEQVTSTRNQMYHTDGPKTFDNRQFGPDGSILISCCNASQRDTWPTRFHKCSIQFLHLHFYRFTTLWRSRGSHSWVSAPCHDWHCRHISI